MDTNFQDRMDGVSSGWSKNISVFVAILATLFLMLPVVAIALMSFSDGRILQMPPSEFSLRWYISVINSNDWANAAVNSFIVALIAVTVSLFMGTCLAISQMNASKRVQDMLEAIVLGPMVMPVIVLSIALFFLMAKFHLVGTRIGLGLSHSIFVLPLVFIIISTVLKRFDNNYIEAAESLGATRIHAFKTILLPFISPALIVSALLAFTASLDEAVIAIFVGGARTLTIPSLMWRSLNLEMSPEVAAVSMIVTAFGMTLQFCVLWMVLSNLRRRGIV